MGLRATSRLRSPSGRAGSATADVMTSARELPACAYPPMRLAPANSSAQRPAESVNFIGSTSVLSAYLFKVFCKWPIQKGPLCKNMGGPLYGPVVRDRDGTPYPGTPAAFSIVN